MTAIQLKNLKKFLQDSSFTHTEEWLSACVQWVQENCNPITDVVLKTQVLEQWRDANLQDMESRCLPVNLVGQRSVQLVGRYGVQVNSIQDIGESAYSQWNRLKKLENENTNVAATDSTAVKNAWEPKPRRCLYLTITDGSQTVYGMELVTISSLSIDLKPGAKIIIIGPVECRRSVFQLKPANVKVIGGEVEDLIERNSLESLLRETLHNPPDNTTVPPTGNLPSRSNNDIIGEFPDSLDVPEDDAIFDDDDFFMDLDETEILASASLSNAERANAETQRIGYQGDVIKSRQRLPELQSRQPESRPANNQNQTDVKKMPPPRAVDTSLAKKTSPFLPPSSSKKVDTAASINVKKINKPAAGFTNSKSVPTSGVKSKKQLKIDGYMKPMPVIIKPPTPQKYINEEMKQEVLDSIVLQSDDDDDSLMDIIEGSFAAELEKAEKESRANEKKIVQTTAPVTAKSSPLGVVRPTKSTALPIFCSKQPYVFLQQVHERWDQLSETNEIVYVKACIATVVSNIQVSNGNWALSVSINDGTGFLNCRISSEILTRIIGFTPTEMKRKKSTKTLEAKEEIANGMAALTTTLVHLNTIIGIEVGPDPVIVQFGDVTLLHINGLKQRVSQLPLQLEA